MKKMYQTTPIKEKNNIITIKPKKARVQITTCKSGVYSFYTKATKKSEKKLKIALKRLDIENL